MPPVKLSKIDETNRGDHYYLGASDHCLYLYEYTSGKDWSFSPTNGLINNLKKPLSTRGTYQWRHKLRAIDDCAKTLCSALSKDWLRRGTVVPVPSSKSKDDPRYDDRILKVCQAMDPGFAVDVRELVTLRESHEAFHAGNRLNVEQLEALMLIDAVVARRAPTAILVVDDVVTSGTHFKAMQRILNRCWPGVPVTGAFIARRVFANPFEALEDEDG